QSWPAPLGPGRSRCLHARHSRQRPSSARLCQIGRRRVPPLQLGRGLARRHRHRRRPHGGQGLCERLGSRPARARLELFPLRDGPVGELFRIFLRHRLHPAHPAMAGAAAQTGGRVFALGARAARLFPVQRRGGGANPSPTREGGPPERSEGGSGGAFFSRSQLVERTPPGSLCSPPSPSRGGINHHVTAFASLRLSSRAARRMYLRAASLSSAMRRSSSKFFARTCGSRSSINRLFAMVCR